MMKIQLEYVLLLWCAVFTTGTATVIPAGTCQLNNVILRNGEYIPVQSQFTESTELELVNSNGILHSTSFSQIPNLRIVRISSSGISPLFFDSFFSLPNLELLEFSNSRLTIEAATSITTRSQCQRFRELRFLNSFVSGLSRSSFYGLRSLTRLEFEGSEITSISFDAFNDLQSITYLSIKSCSIRDFDFTQILRLTSLRYLAIVDIRTNSVIDYSIFRQLPNLEDVLFDADAYNNLDLNTFPRLKTCGIGQKDGSANLGFIGGLLKKVLTLKFNIVCNVVRLATDKLKIIL